MPRNAATVILLRQVAGRAEALLVRRHVELAVAGGAWVFPGGKLETADYSAQSLGRLRGVSDLQTTLAAALGDELTHEQALGLLIAGCRETFEEVGVLLACQEDGSPCPTDRFERLQRCRQEVSRDPARFAALLEESGLVLEASRLLYWSRWITPSIVPWRFDARFFITAMPSQQHVICDSAEAMEPLWLDLASFNSLPDAKLIQAPPTRLTLGELAARLAEHGTVDALLRNEYRRHVATIMPKSVREREGDFAVMPWDPAYTRLPGEGVAVDRRLAERHRGFPSRFAVPRGTMPSPPDPVP